MPPAVAAVAAGGLTAGLVGVGAIGGVTLFGVTYGALASGLIVAATSFAFGMLSQALTPKPKALDAPDLGSFQRDNLLTVRQAAAARSIIFGRTRAGGYLTFIHTTGTDNSKLHLIVTVTGHPVRGFTAMLFEDEVVPLDGSGNATGTYASYVKCVYGTGTTEGDAAFNSALIAAIPDKWTSAHRQSGCAKAYLELTYNSDKFPGGIPNITFIVDGYATVIDPRVSGSPTAMGWTDNAALCIAQYFRDQGRGLGYPADFIDEDTVIAAANACDEMVNRKPVSVGFSNDASGLITLADRSAALRTGTRFTLAGSGSPDSDGLSGYTAHTSYFWEEVTPDTGYACTTLANARAQVRVNPGVANSGGRLAVNGEPRYTLNGVIETEEEPGEVIPRLLSAMAGRKSEPAGKLSLYAGVWAEPTITFSEDDLDGSLTSQHRRSFRDLFNGVKGVFVSPDDLYQPTDFPPVDDTDYIIEDGERIWRDAELRFTNSPSMAQRIARIDLERNRRQIAVSIPLNLRGIKIKAGENFSFSNEKRGWTGKAFYCAQWGLAVLTDERGIRLGVRASGEETDANVFAWDETVDEQTLTPAPTTDLPSAKNIPAPTNIQLFSGTDVLGVREDGTVFSRILVTWTAPASIYVTSGGTIEVEYRKTSGSPTEAWRPYGTVRGDQTRTFILDVDDGEQYQVALTSRSVAGVASERAVTAAHTVIGKTAPPSDVVAASFSAQQNGDVVTFRWDQVTDRDLKGYTLKYMAAPFAWDSAQPLTSVTRGTLVTNAGLPPGTWVVGIKAVDTSDNESDNAATYSIAVTNPNEVVAGEEQAPRWPGLLSGLNFHFSSRLIPKSTILASTMSDEQLWNTFVHSPVDDPYYEAEEIDLGFDAMDVRVWAEVAGSLGPGESGTADLGLEIDTRNTATAYDGFAPWTIGTLDFRYLKSRAVIDTADGVSFLAGFKPQVDVGLSERLYTGQAIAAGGTHLTFNPQFHAVPHIEGTAQLPTGSPTEARFFNYANATETGVDVYLLNSANQMVAGTANITAKGS